MCAFALQEARKRERERMLAQLCQNVQKDPLGLPGRTKPAWQEAPGGADAEQQSLGGGVGGTVFGGVGESAPAASRGTWELGMGRVLGGEGTDAEPAGLQDSPEDEDVGGEGSPLDVGYDRQAWIQSITLPQYRH